jgi:hypothetical protein
VGKGGRFKLVERLVRELKDRFWKQEGIGIIYYRSRDETRALAELLGCD